MSIMLAPSRFIWKSPDNLTALHVTYKMSTSLGQADLELISLPSCFLFSLSSLFHFQQNLLSLLLFLQLSPFLESVMYMYNDTKLSMGRDYGLTSSSLCHCNSIWCLLISSLLFRSSSAFLCSSSSLFFRSLSST